MEFSLTKPSDIDEDFSNYFRSAQRRSLCKKIGLFFNLYIFRQKAGRLDTPILNRIAASILRMKSAVVLCNMQNISQQGHVHINQYRRQKRI
jgi:hypothetical protein